MRGRIVRAIFWKELRDTLRDRRTLIVMVLLPVVLYPALGLGLGQLAAHQIARLQERTVRVALVGEPSAELRAALRRQKGVEVVDVPPGATAAGLVETRAADAAIEVPEGTREALARGATASVRVAVDDTRDESREADRRLSEAIAAYRKDLVARALAQRGLPAGVAEPLRIQRRNVASAERMGASIVARTIPVLLLAMIVLGAFYPAIDVTAGEKERGTLETLLTSPIQPLEIVAGKYLAVVTVAMISGAANLLSVGATFAQGVSMLGAGGATAGFTIALDRVALVFAMLVPVAFLVSALSLAIAVLAQSFKEAQNLLSPTILVLVLPAAAGGLPGVELDPLTAFVPGLNVTLLTKALLLGETPLQGIFAVLLANLIYTGLALVFAARNFRSEAVLFGGFDLRGSLRLRRPAAAASATPGQAFFFFCVIFVLWWYVAQLLQRWDLVGGIVLSQWGILLVPAVAYAAYLRVDLRRTFRLRLPTWRGWVGALLVGAAMAIVIPGVVAPLQELVLPMPKSFIELMKEFFQVARAQAGDVGWILLVAVTPAVCEEAVFRGLLLDGFRSRFSKPLTIGLCALLFGALHMDLYRFFPTAVGGAFLAYVVLETGSIFAAVLAHAVYNGLLAAAPLVYGEGEIVFPVWLAIAGIVVAMVGLIVTRRSE